MADDAQYRKLPASARKLQKARTEGQVARSRDLTHLAAMGAEVIVGDLTSAGDIVDAMDGVRRMFFNMSV